MHRIETLCLALIGCSMLFLAGCYVAAGPAGGPYAGGGATYYYYPDDQVYYYPNVGLYYWYDGGSWHHDRRITDRYRLNDRDRVRFNWSREPHLDHDRIRRDYPGHRDDRDRDRDRDRDKDRDRDRPRY